MAGQDFTPLERDAWGGLVVTHGKLRRRLGAALQEHHHLSHAEFEVLLLLSWAPERRLRLSDLAAKSMLTLSGMSRLVDRLEHAGLVTRTVACEDRRGAYAELTGEGLTRLCAAKTTDSAVIHQHFLALYDARELAVMAGYWRRFLDRERAEAAPCEVAKPAGLVEAVAQTALDHK